MNQLLPQKHAWKYYSPIKLVKSVQIPADFFRTDYYQKKAKISQQKSSMESKHRQRIYSTNIVKNRVDYQQKQSNSISTGDITFRKRTSSLSVFQKIPKTVIVPASKENISQAYFYAKQKTMKWKLPTVKLHQTRTLKLRQKIPMKVDL